MLAPVPAEFDGSGNAGMFGAAAGFAWLIIGAPVGFLGNDFTFFFGTTGFFTGAAGLFLAAKAFFCEAIVGFCCGTVSSFGAVQIEQ